MLYTIIYAPVNKLTLYSTIHYQVCSLLHKKQFKSGPGFVFLLFLGPKLLVSMSCSADAFASLSTAIPITRAGQKTDLSLKFNF